MTDLDLSDDEPAGEHGTFTDVDHRAVGDGCVNIDGLHADSDLRIALMAESFDPDSVGESTTFGDIRHHQPPIDGYDYTGAKPIENLSLETEYVFGDVRLKLTGDDVCWTANDEITASGFVVYDAGSLNEIVTTCDFGRRCSASTKDPDDPSDFMVEWDGAGIVEVVIRG